MSGEQLERAELGELAAELASSNALEKTSSQVTTGASIPDERAQRLAAIADELGAAAGLADGTRAKYRRALERFARFASDLGSPGFPVAPAVVRLFVAELFDGGKSSSTIGVYLAALRWAHKRAGGDDPTADPEVRAVVAESRRRRGTAPERQRRALSLSELGALLGSIGSRTLLDHRDRALLSLGWSTGLRRRELVSIDAEHLRFEGTDLLVWRARAKTDQTGRGKWVGVPLSPDATVCAARHVRRWLRECGTVTGAVFVAIDRHGSMGGRLSPRDVHRVLLRRAELAELSDLAELGAHSLRRGVITECRRRGATLEELRDFIGHATIGTTAGYVEALDALSDRNPLRRLHVSA